MRANKAYHDHHDKPARLRLRGLARNPAMTADLLRRLVDEHLTEVDWPLRTRKSWTGEHIDVLADHPDARVRTILAEAPYLPPARRARLVEDPDDGVLTALAKRLHLPLWTDEPEPSMPARAFERLLERRPDLAARLAGNPWVPASVRDRLPPVTTEPEEAAEPDAESPYDRARAARRPDLPHDVVAALSTDPDPTVRLAVSMRPELTEAQRAAIDYRVRPGDRIVPAGWARTTRDPDVQRRCATSVHIGLRRSVALNRNLAPDLVALLTTDDDFAVRLLLCENHAAVPADLVLRTFVEARTMGRAMLLAHPSLGRDRLAHLADSPEPRLRGLAVFDPEVPAAVIERLSHDPEVVVRGWVADDGRLSAGRALDLLDDPDVTGRAAANPVLPAAVLERILDDARADLTNEAPPGEMHLFLGTW